MITLKNPDQHISVAIEDNEYFELCRHRDFEVDLQTDEKGNKKLFVNGRELSQYEWRYENETGTFLITLKNRV